MVSFLGQQNLHQLFSAWGENLKQAVATRFFCPCVRHESHFAGAALQKAPVQSYLMHLQVMEAKVDFGSGLGIGGPWDQPG